MPIPQLDFTGDTETVTMMELRMQPGKSGHLGAVDDPPDYGEEVRAAYAAEEVSP